VRTISLVPSVTETLSAWGHPPIACTRFCERPDIEHVGGTKDPDVVRIVELRPDLVIVDEEENRREDYDALVGHGVDVFVLHVQSLHEVDQSMTDLADRVGARWTRLDLGEPRPTRARAFIPIWRRPWMALGTPTYGASLLAHLGIANVFDSGERYLEIELADVVSRGADVVLAPSEPYPFTKRQLPELEKIAPTLFVDGQDLFWWGSRTRDALSRLAESLATLP
jgi:ABC-type Fe3+-hydroxamate transport system substrate-binding protein